MTVAANDQGFAHLANYFSESLKDRDPELYASMEAELHRQQHEIELIASENIVSQAVLEAQGSVLTNKYAEGYPGKRYYGGCEHVDVAENLAIDRACKICSTQYGLTSQPRCVSRTLKARGHNSWDGSRGRWTSNPWRAAKYVWEMV